MTKQTRQQCECNDNNNDNNKDDNDNDMTTASLRPNERDPMHDRFIDLAIDHCTTSGLTSKRIQDPLTGHYG
jgi:hypothetical protein